MEVQVISNTIQKFNGESFYLCGCYFQHKGKRLHRTVWEYHNGDIPDGYHVHHKDGDRTNNQIENLDLMTTFDHLSSHGKDEKHIEKKRDNIKKAIAKAPEWHASPEGKAWHSQNGKESWKNRKAMPYECSYCGKTFYSRNHYPSGGNRFCHSNCRAAYRRMRIRNGEIEK